MDILRQGNKYFLFFILYFLFFILSSCNNKESIWKTRSLYISISRKNIGNDVYQNIYNYANDSINTWIHYSLKEANMQKYALQWQLDSLICFNNELNKCRMLIMNQESKTVNNSVNYFYGVKIDKNWFFFYGSTVYLFSDRYSLPKETPLSFEKMKEIATSTIYRGYLRKGKKGQWEINENFFSDIIPQDGSIEFYGLKDEKEYVKFRVEINWSSDVKATFKKYKERNDSISN